tara:strand:- start:2274 stop:2918 length:645 start_codon:yes stop_codon:yes gene_type:complete
LSAQDNKFKVVMEDSEQSVEKLTERLGQLQDAQYNETGMMRFTNLTQDLTYSVSGAVGGLETLGYVTYEQSEAFRKAETVMQLMLIPYELYNVLNSFAIATEVAHTQSLLAQAAATSTTTKATVGLNTALLANPITLVILGVIALVAALVALQMKFDILNKSLEAVEVIFETIRDVIGQVVDGLDNLGAKAGVVSNVMKASPVGMALELYGGVR